MQTATSRRNMKLEDHEILESSLGNVPAYCLSDERGEASMEPDVDGEWINKETAEKFVLAELIKLRAALEAARDEICEGPVDDVLWHDRGTTTVDNITMALDDGWTYDGWLQAKEDQV